MHSHSRQPDCCCGSVAVELDHRLGEVLWRFLRDVVPDAAEDPVCVFPAEHLTLANPVPCGPVEVAAHGGGHRDGGPGPRVLFRDCRNAAHLSEPQTPAIVVDGDIDMAGTSRGVTLVFIGLPRFPDGGLL